VANLPVKPDAVEPLMAAGRAVQTRRIAVIVFAQRIGLTLEEIGAELAKLSADRSPTRQGWARLSRGWTKRIDQKIAELQRLRDGLTRLYRLRMSFNRQMPTRKILLIKRSAGDPALATGSPEVVRRPSGKRGIRCSVMRQRRSASRTGRESFATLEARINSRANA
jgi:DNA-binding transcriptional MerR regulator